MSDLVDPQKKEVFCSFSKKALKNKCIRKRPAPEEDNGVVYRRKKTSPADNKLHFASGSSKLKLDSKSPIFQFESVKEIQVHNDSKATATLETETDVPRDGRAMRERVLKQSEEALKGKSSGTGGEKLYKGINGYTDHRAGFRREHTVSSEKAGGSHGPLRASANIRVSTRVDYQPDVCKDYKETGYCGYGDSCKFMHDRGDYKSGSPQMNLAVGIEDAADKSEEEGDDGLPFACFICRGPFVNPVVTKCKHYFCVKCALEHHKKNNKCFACNQPTEGTFNTASEILKRMAVEGK